MGINVENILRHATAKAKNPLNKRLVDITNEALQRRGFTEGEAGQIVRRLIEHGEGAKLRDYATIPFGKYKNWSIDRVPTTYLSWLISQGWFREKYDALYQDILNIL